MSQAVFRRGSQQDDALGELGRRGIALNPVQRIQAGLSPRPPLFRLSDFIAERLGTRRWLVAFRLTDFHRLQGYELSIVADHYRALTREHATYLIEATRPAAAER